VIAPPGRRRTIAKPAYSKLNAPKHSEARADMADVEGQMLRIGRVGPVLDIALAHPPVNALDPQMCAALSDALDLASVTECGAVLIRGEAGVFSVGHDAGSAHGADAVALRLLCKRIEELACPVIVLLQGPALGGAAELALAAHLRLADETVQFALPEVAFGLLPGAGSTQRLPRLVGAAGALDLMLSGRVVGAAEALAMGVIDRVVTGDAETAGRAAARDLAMVRAQGGTWQRTDALRTGFRDVAAYRAALATAREGQRGSRLPAPGRIVDCVEAALLLPFEQGVAFEAAAYDDLSATPQSLGLRHAFRAERAARRLPAAVAALEPVAVPQRLAIWGAGGEGAAIARQALQAGMSVSLADPSKAGLVAALETIAAAQEAEVKAGRMTPEARDADWARLMPLVGQERLPEAEVVITTRPDLVLPAPRVVLALGVEPPKGAVALALVPQAEPLAEMVLEGASTPARAAQAVAFGRRLGWSVVPVGPGGPVAVVLATALAETVGFLEGRGVPRATIAQALALAGIAGEGRAGVAKPAEEAVARRCFGALANAGARLIEAGTARDGDTVDAVAIAAGIVARWTGGPMHQADQRGLMVMRRDLRLWAHEAPGLFAPSPLFDRLISDGKGFSAP
jgi:3-hydroxyacyl-CoA dehydrogenase